MSFWRDFCTNGCILAGVIVISFIVYFYSKDECPVGTMPCSSGNICIPQKYVCNGQIDCPGREDEDGILCADLHGSTQLINIILNSSIEESLASAKTANLCDVQEYPVMCLCGYRSRIYCNNAQFTEIPQNISQTVTYLGLQNNSITVLTVDSLQRYNLTLLKTNTCLLYNHPFSRDGGIGLIGWKQDIVYLSLKFNVYLGGNDIIYVASNVFQHQHSLKKLFLMNNNLSSLEIGVFNGLYNLEWLHLDNNKLKNLTLSIFEVVTEVKWLNLSYNNLDFKDNESFPVLPILMELYLTNNKIKRIGNNLFSNLSQLSVLNLRSNRIKIIESKAFQNLKNLEELDLYDNCLIILSEKIFINQKELTKLSLGINPVKYLQSGLINNLRKLVSLNLEGLEISIIDTDVFKDLTNLKAIYFKSYKYCSYAPAVPRCSPLSDGISSTTQLLFKPIFRYSIWIMCLITIVGNTLVLFGRFLFRDKNKNLSIVIKNLAVSDGLMGIYLFIIAYHDLKFRDNYNTAARKWMSSWNCALTGIIGMASLEVSVMILVFMSVDRYFVITMPYRKFGVLNFKETWRVLLCIWCFGISISVLPALGFMSSTKFYGVNGLCFPLYMNDPYLVGWEYSALIFFGINAPSLIIIIYAYGGMFINIKKTRNATSVQMDDSQFAIKFIFIVLTNVACWLPIIIAKLIVYFEVEISADVYGWLTVFVLPINSSINPILYTLSTRKYRKRLVKVPSFIKWLTVSRNLGRNHQVSETIYSIVTKNIKN